MGHGPYWPLLKQASFLGDSLGSIKNWLEPKTKPSKPSLSKFNQVELVHISDTLCSTCTTKLQRHCERKIKCVRVCECVCLCVCVCVCMCRYLCVFCVWVRLSSAKKCQIANNLKKNFRSKFLFFLDLYTYVRQPSRLRNCPFLDAKFRQNWKTRK